MSLAARLRGALSADRAGATPLRGDVWDSSHSDTAPSPAAVLVPVVDRPEPGVILTRRAEGVSRHAGQIAFPGGRIDPGDPDEIAAALREAEEEIGLPAGEVEVIGLMDRYRTISGFEITPVLAIVPPNLDLTAQPDEVASIFEAPLHFLIDPQHQILRSVEWQGRQRSYYEIEWGEWRIWGATAAMIVNLGYRLEIPV